MTSPASPDRKVEQLAHGLRAALRQRRFRPARLILGTLALGAVTLAVVLWSVYYRGGETPRLQLLALDDMVHEGQTPRARARLVALDTPIAPRLSGQDVVFLDPRAADATPRQGKTTSDAQGFAALDWPLPAGASSTEFQARYIDARHRRGNDGTAHLFVWPRGSVLLLVEVDSVLAEPLRAGGHALEPQVLVPRPGAESALDKLREEVHVVYLSTAEKLILSRLQRSFVETRFDAQPSLPAGPIFGQADFAEAASTAAIRRSTLARLRRDFDGPLLAVANDRAAVTFYQEEQVRVLWLGADAPDAALPRAATWAEVPAVVRQQVAKK
jgi:hypothetical protein